jgi:bifunctional ADP-heptose synthase (sugar kinase/adenylyltransferase)
VNKNQNSEKLVAIFDALSDITITVVADFLSQAPCGGVVVSLRLAELGITVLPVGVVGEDERGQGILKALHEHRVSTAGISKVKNYVTPNTADKELIHGEHAALLNLIENARKLASASDAMYLCDYGVGAASPRLLNFIKSDGCVREKTLAARSRQRLTEFEQLTTAIASEDEVEQAIGIPIAGNAQKLAVAGEGIVEEMKLESFFELSDETAFIFSGSLKPAMIAWRGRASDGEIDVLGGLFAAALASGAEAVEAAQLAVQAGQLLLRQPRGAKRLRREEIVAGLVRASTSGPIG